MMLRLIIICGLLSIIVVETSGQNIKNDIEMRELTKEEKRVIEDKGTEAPFVGIYTDHNIEGIYSCRRCGEDLFLSDDKFASSCGWPSFDGEVRGAVKRIPDADGHRTEIVCARCDAHLGHIFEGEGLTTKNVRYCVNSISMDFKPLEQIAIFAGGCFWGVEHLMQQQDGVKSVVSGYTGGTVVDPTYKEICTKTTGHAEAVKITYDPSKIDYQTLVKLFMEIHDPTQEDGQGPDIGPQYRSEIFYLNAEQADVARGVISLLESKGYDVATKVTPLVKFYAAEDYHQDYYDKKGAEPYCHFRVKRF